MKNELGRQIMKKFVGLRAKAYSFLKENNDSDVIQTHNHLVLKRTLNHLGQLG